MYDERVVLAVAENLAVYEWLGCPEVVGFAVFADLCFDGGDGGFVHRWLLLSFFVAVVRFCTYTLVCAHERLYINVSIVHKFL